MLIREVMRALSLALLCLSAVVVSAADPFMNLYDGFWSTRDGKMGRVTAQVRPLGGGKYDGFVALYRSQRFVGALKLGAATANEGKVSFTGSAAAPEGDLAPQLDGHCQIANGRLTGAFKGDLGEGSFEASGATNTPPSMGVKPPPNGIVIFDGKSGEKFGNFKWTITPEGSMVVKGGDIVAKDQFANFLLHVEFKTPLMAEAKGQARGNSGVYLQGKYEVQVLDSFGLFPLQNNDCSGIYGIKAPDSNACLPPGVWQTYDITYVAPHEGKGPTITVVHNGVTVHEKVEIPKQFIDGGTTAASQVAGFLKLQDHGNPVEYRNIWVEPFFAASRK